MSETTSTRRAMKQSVTLAVGGVTLLAAIIAGRGQTTATPSQIFHHCSLVGQSSNSPHLFDVSETYQCKEGRIEISGVETMTVEEGYVYVEELGRLGVERPRPVTSADYKNYKWCQENSHRAVRCGDKPNLCYDGKLGTWDEKWQGYSCVTPDHK